MTFDRAQSASRPSSRLAETPAGRLRHGCRERLSRHCHREPFAAVVLDGEYLEAGDAGRRHVAAGDVILHGAYESHLNEVGARGAEVLVLPWPSPAIVQFGYVKDPDAVVHASERSVEDAVRVLAGQLMPAVQGELDWPDRLARDLRLDPALSLADWSKAGGLRPETVSRGFRRAYGVAPKAYRARARLLAALPLVARGDNLAELAAELGFADQSHFGRDFFSLTGQTPAGWRRLGSLHCVPRAGRPWRDIRSKPLRGAT